MDEERAPIHGFPWKNPNYRTCLISTKGVEMLTSNAGIVNY